MTDHDETVTGSLKAEVKAGDLPPEMLVTLEVVEGPDKGQKVEVRSTVTILGRKSPVLPLSDPTVSGRHALLEIAGVKIFVTDQESTNGTTVNGDRVDSAPVGNLDVIGLGDTRLLLSVVQDRYQTYLDGPVEAADEDTGDSRVPGLDETTLADRPLPNPELPDSLYVVLEVKEGEDKGKKFRVTRRSTIIGRSDQSDFQVSDPAASSRHCQLEIHNKDKMTVKDLASKNGTRVNDHYVSAVKIRHGDLIKIGTTTIAVLIHLRK